jgi:hypothetical protein
MECSIILLHYIIRSCKLLIEIRIDIMFNHYICLPGIQSNERLMLLYLKVFSSQLFIIIAIYL